MSAQAVKSAIRALIAGEGAKILSDDTLVELLKAKGFDIARRTVAKYREAMGIGSSVQRRRAAGVEGVGCPPAPTVMLNSFQHPCADSLFAMAASGLMVARGC